MPNLLEEKRLILTEVGQNSNKFYYLSLFDDDSVTAVYGRVGVTEQRTNYSGGRFTFEKKLREKTKKGYTELKLASTNTSTQVKTVDSSNLHEIAKRQIRTTRPELEKLIDRLVKANIHKITSSTQITYNDTTGLFTTPLGVVTQEAIDDARLLLVEIQKFIRAKDHGNKELFKVTSNYLRLVPHAVGMKLDTRTLFPDEQAVIKENDILDSLEASLKTLQTAPKVDKTGQVIPEEKVFDVELDILDTQTVEHKHLSDFFYNTKKRMHGYDQVKITQIFKVSIKEMDQKFNRKLGNIVEVFHGTSQANLLSILKSGIKVSPPSTAYIAGKMFGCGTYGAINSTKSLGYTFGRWGGSTGDSGWLLICDFAMGRTNYPTNTRGPFPGQNFDSVWAKADRTGLHHDELIVYQDNQANIKYLIECK